MTGPAFFCLALFTSLNAISQQLPPEGTPSVAALPGNVSPKKTVKTAKPSGPKISFTGGIGMAGYVGDLIKSTAPFQQSSYSASAGLNYALIPHLNARFDLGFHQVQGYDNKSGGAHPERNLSFESKILEFAVAAEYTLVNLDKHRFSPYIFIGIGAFHFNPRAYFGAGGTHPLRELGTEGQGLAGYPGLYSTMAVEYPIGGGIKYVVNKKITLLGEFCYRPSGTDYLDDVSTNYPNKALLDARNPNTSKFTYRGDGAYPTNPALKRGNPGNKDAYYTTQLKVAYRLQAKTQKNNTDKTVVLPAKNNDSDKDGDGITDVLDKCPDIKGTVENNGCPFPYIEGAELVSVSADSMTYRIYFDLDRALLLPDAFKTLKAIVQILKADNNLSVNISGHTDNNGTSAANQQLSAERANITRDYLLSYNIAAEKITTAYYGETQPVDTAQQWRNRRVELTLVRK